MLASLGTRLEGAGRRTVLIFAGVAPEARAGAYIYIEGTCGAIASAFVSCTQVRLVFAFLFKTEYRVR